MKKSKLHCTICTLTRLQVQLGIMCIYFRNIEHSLERIYAKQFNIFFKSGILFTEVNHTFITLVPKTSNASHLNDLRPISFYNTLYKIITKVLPTRLQQVIGGLISHNQSAFLKGRLISDSSLLGHELARDFNNPMGSRLCLKIDLQKAFDTINREIKYFILHCMCFTCRWINWEKECMSSPFFLFNAKWLPSWQLYKQQAHKARGSPLILIVCTGDGILVNYKEPYHSSWWYLAIEKSRKHGDLSLALCRWHVSLF